jgi:hypothetical protein
VLEQNLGEIAERFGQRLTRGRIRTVLDEVGLLLDPVQQVRNGAVVGLQAVDIRAELGGLQPDRREQHGVLEPVVAVDELAVAQAAHLHLEQRPVDL